MFRKVNQQSGARHAFTLVELLVVIAIIALLIGIAVPSISAARTAAKKVATLATIKSLGEGCEAFNGEFNNYPKSDARGGNPFINGENDLSGAQWLTIQLSGPDLQGYVDWRDSKANARGTTPGINHEDWQAWYGLDSTGEYRGLRVGPYVTADSSITMTPERLIQEGTRAISLSSDFDQSERPFTSAKLPFFQDRWGNPILYYAANVGSPLAFTPADGGGGPGGGDGGTGGSAFTVNDGIYDQEDNRLWTGLAPERTSNADNSINDKRTDLGANEPHHIRKIGYLRDQRTPPDDGTFAGFLYDKPLFEQTRQGNEGKIRPYNPQSFILISAGDDRIFGTNDDVRNFNN